jgi:hypothetical protein
MENIIEYAQLFYQEVTKEKHLFFKRKNTNIEPWIRTEDGEEFLLANDAPSGSEQATIALGIMAALARTFHGLLIIDEVADRFDHDSIIAFYRMIRKLDDIFVVIVLKFDSPRSQIEEEFKQIQEFFVEGQILSPKRYGELDIRVIEAKSAEDIQKVE